MVTFGIEVIRNFDEYNKGFADKKNTMQELLWQVLSHFILAY